MKKEMARIAKRTKRKIETNAIELAEKLNVDVTTLDDAGGRQM